MNSGEDAKYAYLFGRYGLLAGLAELLDGLLVEPQVLLAANEDLGDVGAEVMYFRAPLSESKTLTNDLESCVVPRCADTRRKPRLTFSPTLSKESGESTAKQIKMTWESGYDRGRRRS